MFAGGANGDNNGALIDDTNGHFKVRASSYFALMINEIALGSNVII
jgi:hypothetical protein